MPASIPTSPGMQELNQFLVWPSEECRLALQQARMQVDELRAASLAPNGQPWRQVAGEQAAIIDRLHTFSLGQHALLQQVAHHRELLAAAKELLQTALSQAARAGMETNNRNAYHAAANVAIAMRTLYGDDEVEDEDVEIDNLNDPEVEPLADGEEEEDDWATALVEEDGDEEEAGEERHYHRI